MKFAPVAVLVLLAAAPASLVTASASSGATVHRCGGKVATIVGTNGDDFLFGTRHADVIVGLRGDDQIYGGGGHDVICGGRGLDRLEGRGGADLVYGGHDQDFLVGGAGDDRLIGGTSPIRDYFDPGSGNDTVDGSGATLGPSIDYGFAPRSVTVDLAAGTATGWGHDRFIVRPRSITAVQGSNFDDTMLGSPGRDALMGRGGYDTILGFGDDDQLDDDEGSLSGGEGNDEVTFRGGVAAATSSIDAGPGDDRVIVPVDYTGALDAGEGDDDVQVHFDGNPWTTLAFTGGPGRDRLWLQTGFDTTGVAIVADLTTGNLQVGDVTGTGDGFENFQLTGRAASVEVTGTDGPNRVFVGGGSLGGIGDATLRGLAGDDWLESASALHAVVDGGDGNDTTVGAGGDDTLIGSTGDDRLIGGPGTDTADGGDGIDTCLAVESATNCEASQL